MITLWLSMVLARPLAFDRVDVLSEASPTWLHDELPRRSTSGRFVAVRFIEQVQPVLALPVEGLELGFSLRSQVLRYESAVNDDWSVNGGLLLGALLPNGLSVGTSWRPSKVRIGASLSLVTTANWNRPAWAAPRLLPGVGIGLGRDVRPTAVWMK
ncbi:MAG: hypothetical protein GWP91_10100 [Rhodobacterales bacterium]|nr:hypothetical protein [Rhodobacterales bacterium]